MLTYTEPLQMSSYVYDLTTYNNLYGTRVIYDEQSRISYVYHGYDYKYSSGIKNDRTVYSYAYNANNGNLLTMSIGGSMLGEYFRGSITPTYDNLGRTSQKIIDIDANENDAFYNKLTYNYIKSESELYDSGRVSQVTSEVRKGSTTSVISSNTYNYTYDANGNITQITNASDVVQYNYYYDDLGQLIREDNRAKGYTYVYTYDNAGNITSKKRYAFTTNDSLGSVQNTTSYTYGDSSWKDLLTNYAGLSITYDNIGNPLTIGDKTLTWKGRELISYADEGTTVSYGYNADGIRTYKEINNGGQIERHEYVLSGSQIVKETVFVNGVEQYILVYVYDEAGAPIGLKYRTPSYAENVYTCYFFEKNLQGDIVAIYNSAGTKIGTYTYDAWGNGGATMLNASGVDRLILLSYNPFKYRGYYYDTDSGWYYLQSRYYDANWGRFLNTDNQISGIGGEILGNNLFVYCFNNPVNLSDFAGNWPDWDLLVKGALLAVIGTGVAVATVASLGTATGPACALGYLAASVIIVGSATTAVIGTTEVAEALTGTNPIKDAMGEENFEATKNLFFLVTSMGASYLSAGGDFSVCFVAGTEVHIESGTKPIEKIAAGDYVWATDPETGETELKQVVQTFVNETNELIYIQVAGEKIVTTPEHPFYSPIKGWIAACKLRAGDLLVLQNGKYITVEKVQHEILESPIKVYNFEVADFHTYYVGKSAVFVHNTCGGNSSSKTALPKNGTKVNSSVALDMADDFLGPGYTEVSPSRFVSADGFRQVRMANADILGLHGGGPHINFDRLYPNYKSVHIYIFDD